MVKNSGSYGQILSLAMIPAYRIVLTLSARSGTTVQSIWHEKIMTGGKVHCAMAVRS